MRGAEMNVHAYQDEDNLSGRDPVAVNQFNASVLPVSDTRVGPFVQLRHYENRFANLLDAVGYRAEREYYINDSGRQMEILAVSTWLRYLEHCGERFAFPANGYRGEYITEIGERLYLSPLTAKTHVSRIMSKLGARDRVHLVVVAYETGLVQPGWL